MPLIAAPSQCTAILEGYDKKKVKTVNNTNYNFGQSSNDSMFAFDEYP